MRNLTKQEILGIVLFTMGFITSIVEAYRIIQNTFHGGDTFLWIIGLGGLFFGVLIYADETSNKEE